MIEKNKYGSCEYSFEVDYVHIYNLYIHPEFRRRGKAREILLLVINNIRNTGYRGVIQIVANPSEKAIDKERLYRFYKSLNLEVYSYYGKEKNL